MYFLLGIALVSAAGLAFEITLTRLFAISQGYHFGFLAVSLALLGFGASGTALAVRRRVTQDAIEPRLARWSFLFALSLGASYLTTNHLPFDPYRIAWEPIQFLWLVLFYLALAIPFFLSGLVLGFPLAAIPQQANSIYAANLFGSGFGCVAALGALTIFSISNAIIFSAMLAAFGSIVFSLGHKVSLRYPAMAVLTTLVLGVVILTQPPLLDLRLSPYKGLSQTLRFPDARLVAQSSNAFSQVQVVESNTVRSAPGLSLTYRGAMPAQRALFVDAESVSPLTNDAPRDLLDRLPVTLAYQLRPNARALILEPGGGLEILAALNAGAHEIVVLEPNPLVAHAAQVYAPRAFGDPHVRLVVQGVRSYLAQSREHFDVVHLALDDSFRPVMAGAFALGENYTYTHDAFRDYLNHLTNDGILVVSRWLQLPPTEESRTGALVISALNVDDPSQHILALRSFSTLFLLAKRTPFTQNEIEIAREFTEARQFDWVAYPSIRVEETNRFNVLLENEYYRLFQQLLDQQQRVQLFATYAYEIAPPTDDRPFFFHFFKWEQIPQVLQLLGKTWQPFGGSGYLILLALLGLSVIVAGSLILLPLLSLRTKRSSPKSNATLVYFACLGIAFLFVEIPLIQRFILFLDQPVYAFAMVLFTLLIASGAGSAVSVRLPQRRMLALLVAAIIVYPFVLAIFFPMFLGLPLAARLLIAFLLLTPLGFLMGIPFPKGIAQLNEHTPSIIPLAWGINGFAAVISSILATMGALSFGFSAVLLAGACSYALALVFSRQRI